MAMTRRWTLAGWGFLTAAIISGGWWSYEVLGWGGYWAWDPVENVSFMPWLTATAFLHSVQVQERRRMLKSWNVLLIVLTFALSILGTFLTRSGVVSSVHAFGDGPVGPVFLGFFFVVAIASLGLVAWRWDQVRDRAELDAAVSREGAFLTVNVLFLAMTFAVLIGTLFPLIVEAINGARVTVGAPFFDQTSLPLWMIVLLLMGVGPLLPWRKAETQSLRRNLAIMAVAFAVAVVGALALGMRAFYPVLTIGLAGWNLASVGLLLAGAVVPRARLARRGLAATTLRYAFEQRRKVGSMSSTWAWSSSPSASSAPPGTAPTCRSASPTASASPRRSTSSRRSAPSRSRSRGAPRSASKWPSGRATGSCRRSVRGSTSSARTRWRSPRRPSATPSGTTCT
jgi:cytochrome c-type biogenesis protein CcmF